MSVNVAVTGLQAADNPAPGIGVVRSLRYRDGWNGDILGLAYDVYDTGIYDPGLFDRLFLFPFPSQGADALMERLRYIHESYRVDVVIPTLDSEVVVFERLATRLKKMGIASYLPSAAALRRRSKEELVRFCKSVGIEVPPTEVVRDLGALGPAMNSVGFPLFVKGIFYEAYRCVTEREVHLRAEDLVRRWGLPILLQREVPGDEFNVACVCGAGGQLLGAVPIRKVRRTDKGKAWVAVTLRNERLLHYARKCLQSLEWRGACELEILQEEKTRRLFLLEINPRFPAWIYLSAGAEHNLPRLLVDLALGRAVTPLPAAKAGITFVRHATDLICPLEQVERLTVEGELHHEPAAKGAEK